jgi:hypothetical protein
VLEVNDMITPGTMLGAIGVADDGDIFRITIAPGEFWQWDIVAEPGSSYVPHLTVFDTATSSLNPTELVAASLTTDKPRLDHFVLRSGSFVAAVRDARNVPASSSKHVGDASLKYRLVASKVTPTPAKMTLPGTASGALKYVANAGIHSFTTTKGTKIKLAVKAQRKTPASKLDSRMSLFHVGTKTTVLTNDDASGTTDSEITGPMHADGEYWVIVENEAAMASTSPVPDLSYDLDLSLAP